MHTALRRLAVLAAVAATTAAGFSAATPAGASTSSTSTGAAKTERVCSAPTAHRLACYAIKQVSPKEPAALHSDAVAPAATPSGYGPSDLRSAYKLTASGSGTVAIVDAYNDPNAASPNRNAFLKHLIPFLDGVGR